MQNQDPNTVEVPEIQPFKWRLVFATCLGPPVAAILMHIPVFITHPEPTLTVLGIAMTVVGTLTISGLLITILPQPDKHRRRTKAFLVAAALLATAGVLLISRNQIY